MKTVALISALAALSVVATAPVQAQSSRQTEKNMSRTGAYALGALAVHKLLQGRTNEAIALGAGAGYAGKKYEDARKAQSDENGWRRDNRYDNRNDRWDDRRDNDRWDRDDRRGRDRRDDDDCRDERHTPRGRAIGWHRNHGR